MYSKDGPPADADGDASRPKREGKSAKLMIRNVHYEVSETEFEVRFDSSVTGGGAELMLAPAPPASLRPDRTHRDWAEDQSTLG
jgi:hypothetical protein